jgi:hypothetical protein
MSQQQQLDEFQRSWGQSPTNRPPTPDPFAKPLYMKYQLDSAWRDSPTTPMDLCVKRELPQQAQSRMQFVRRRRKNHRAATLRDFRATQPAQNFQATVAYSKKQDQMSLPQAMEGLKLETHSENGENNRTLPCRFCGKL